MTTEVQQFVLDCLVFQVEKGSHLEPGGKLMPLDIPARKRDHVAIDFAIGMPMYNNCNTILAVVDKATKICHFVACNKKIFTKEVVHVYWHRVGSLHGSSSMIILDRDV